MAMSDIPDGFPERTDHPGSLLFRYRAKVQSVAVGGGMLYITFHPTSGEEDVIARFRGGLGGIALGDFTFEGTAEFALPIEAMQDWEATFNVTGLAILGGGMRCEMFALDERPIGVVSGSGAGLGVSLSFGRGSFDQVRPLRLDSVLTWKGEPGNFIAAATSDDGAELVLDRWEEGAQRWRLLDAGGGFFMIASEQGGKVVEMRNFDDANGARLQLWSRNGGDNQLWFFARHAKADVGQFSIVNKHSGKAIDVPSEGPVRGAVLQQWTLHGGDNQRWTMLPG